MRLNKRDGFKTRILYEKNNKIINFKNLHYLKNMLNYELTLGNIDRSTSINEIEIGQEGKYIDGDFYKSLILSIPRFIYCRRNDHNSIKDIANNLHIFDDGNNIC